MIVLLAKFFRALSFEIDILYLNNKVIEKIIFQNGFHYLRVTFKFFF